MNVLMILILNLVKCTAKCKALKQFEVDAVLEFRK